MSSAESQMFYKSAHLPKPEPVDIVTGQLAPKDGYYAYFGHKNSEECGYTPTQKEKCGQIVLRDMPAPPIYCKHDAVWRLVEELKV